MKEKLRGFLGFLGLIEDEYGEYGAPGPARPFSEQPVLNDEPEWSSPAPQGRHYPPATTSAAPMRAPSPQPVRTSSISVLDGGGQVPRMRPMPSPGVTRSAPSFAHEREIAVFLPRSYNESRRITDLLRANRPVVLNVNDVDPGVGRRLVDFAAGTAYALTGRMEVLESGVYLVCPHGVTLSDAERERLRMANYRDFGNA